MGAGLTTFRAQGSYDPTIVRTWTPKVCKIMTFMAVIMGLGLLFHILLGVMVLTTQLEPYQGT